jgi:hypothetical protein
MSGKPAASDEASAEWLRALTATGAEREAGLARLHGLLVRVAVRELHRREAGARISGRELDDLAHQAADDDAEWVTDDVAAILARPARAFRQFAADYATASS